MIQKIIYSLFFFILGGFLGNNFFGDFNNPINLVIYGALIIIFFIFNFLIITKSSLVEQNERVKNEMFIQRIKHAMYLLRYDIIVYDFIYILLITPYIIWNYVNGFNFGYAIEFTTFGYALMMIFTYRHLIRFEKDLNKAIDKELEK